MQKTPKGEDVHENSFVQRQQQTSRSGAVSWCRCNSDPAALPQQSRASLPSRPSQQQTDESQFGVFSDYRAILVFSFVGLLGEIVDRDGKLQHPTSSPLRYTLPCASEFQSRPLFAAIAYSHCRISTAVLSGPPTVLRGDSSTTIHASANMFI